MSRCSTTGKPTHLFRTKCASLDGGDKAAFLRALEDRKQGLLKDSMHHRVGVSPVAVRQLDVVEPDTP